MRASDNDLTSPSSATRRGSDAGPRLVMFVEEGGGDWHARQLVAALATRGATVVVTTLKDCAFDTRCASGLDIPGFDGALPDGAFVRSVSTGSLEQITLRLGILHALEASGVTVWNNARAIERCVDKSTATFLFQRAGLTVPTTRAAENLASARRFLVEIGGPIVVKPLFGSQGNGVRRADSQAELPAADEVGNVYYTQRYLRSADDTQFQDWRVLVSNGRVLSAMVRVGRTWITNIHQGADAIAVALHDADYPHLVSLALRATEAVGARYAGVDLIRDQSGELLVLEINSNPAWKGLQSVTEMSIAEALAADFLAAVDRAGARPALMSAP